MHFGTLLLAFVSAAHAADGVGSLPAPALIGGAVLVAALVIAVAVRAAALGVLAASGTGALASVYLTTQHFVAKSGGASLCTASSVLNCDKINTSEHSELGGVPIALYGLGFYAAMAFLGYALRGAKGASAGALVLVGGVIAVGYDIFLAWASYNEGALCIFCTLTWVLNATLLGCGYALCKRAGVNVGSLLGKGLGDHAGPTLVVGMVVFIAGVLVSRQAAAPVATGAGGIDFAALYEKPMGRVELDGTEPVKGDPAARFTLVEWADYECPHCALMAPILKAIVTENKDAKLLFKHYPIAQACNRFVPFEGHQYACAAAAAAECARLQGRFWELSEAMFKNQTYLAPSDIRFMAEKQGIESASFEACLQSPAATDAVKADVEGGGTAEIEGTPSLFLLGTHGDQWLRLKIGPGDTAAVNALLAAARSGQPLPPVPDPAPHDHEHE